VEKCETKGQALVRECQEELAINVEPHDIKITQINELYSMAFDLR